MSFQKEKKLVLDFYEAIEASELTNTKDVLSRYCSEALLWRGFHPFNQINDCKTVCEIFWNPLKFSLSSLTRRKDIFFAGNNSIAGHEGIWVASMGHLMGLFDKPWLDIPPTKKMIFLRYAEFNKVVSNKIVETAMFFDIPHFMTQAGLSPFHYQTGANLVQPGPSSHDGLLFEEQDDAETMKTRKAIEGMIEDVKIWKSTDRKSLIEELEKSWDKDMLWWGPTGIGATYTIERYAEQHSGPFRESFKERKFNGHICRITEGLFGGFFGWPNLSLVHSGGFMGMPSTGKSGDMRVIDIYRREGEKLKENWIFIDLLHFWKMQDVDILERTTKISH
ncbi:MAG: ester cyclase [Paracoccaceae bacterium]